MNNHCLIFSAKQNAGHGRNAGPYSIATTLRQNGWDTTIIDYFLYWKQEELIPLIRRSIKPNTKWVGISYTWVYNELDKLLKLIEFVKSIKPDLKIIVGGQAPYVDDLKADWYVYGYAEHAILKILDYEFNDGLPVMYTKHHGGRMVNAFHNYPSYNLPNYAIEYQENDFVGPGDTLTIQMSRGCKFKCDFCSFPFTGIKEDTSVTEEHLYKELMTNYEKYGVKNYIISDETVNDRVEKLVKIRNVVNRLPFKPNFTAFTRIDLFRSHPEKMELMAESRIWGHYYGVESFNWQTAKSIGKGLNPEYIKESLITVKDYFKKHLGVYRGTVSMIAGLPHETLDQVRDSYKWLVDNWGDQQAGFWPLQLIDNGELSAMGRDFAKYGYEKMQPHEYIKKTPLANTQLYWKNKYTNIYEVHDLVNNEFTYDWRLGNFVLFHVLPYSKYEQALSYTYSQDWHILINQSRMSDYIQKKKNS
jgi:radical SAM superfamily enzyme YgiQ (UPF0313 family)